MKASILLTMKSEVFRIRIIANWSAMYCFNITKLGLQEDPDIMVMLSDAVERVRETVQTYRNATKPDFIEINWVFIRKLRFCNNLITE